MLRNITPREHKEIIEYRISFRYKDDPEAGFSFECDKNGTPHFEYEEARKNYEDSIAHPERFCVYNRFKVERRSYIEPASGDCICGKRIQLWDQYMGACECQCGRWYNLFGQELIHPRYWEDDGEDY